MPIQTQPKTLKQQNWTKISLQVYKGVTLHEDKFSWFNQK